MKNLVKVLLSVIVVFTLVFGVNNNAQAQQKKQSFEVAWSIYAGWNPWAYAKSSGILDKWAQKYGIEIKLVKFDYIPSIEAFTTKSVDACVMTNMDCLTIPVSNGIKCTAIINGDFSNGNDAIITREGIELQQALQETILGVEFSVSHYMVYRAAQKNNMDFDKIHFKNTSDSEIQAVFTERKENKVVATWNPMVMNILKVPGMKSVFTSANIPGEVLDLMVVKDDVLKANPELAKALVGAWYEVMNVMSSRTDKGTGALKEMAAAGGSSLIEYKSQLNTTAMFYTPEKAIAYTESDEVKTNMKRVRNFCHMFELLGVDKVDDLGIQFSDGTVSGNQSSVLFKFDMTYTKMAAKGEL